MNGYLTFLKGLSAYQQRGEIGRLAFTERWCGSSLEEELFKGHAMSEFSEIFDEHPATGRLDLNHYAEESELFGIPVFDGDQCRATFLFRYQCRDRNIEITGTIYIDDDGKAIIAARSCRTCSGDLYSRDRLIRAGIDPHTLETLSYSRWQPLISYLDYLEGLLPQQRRDAIFGLAKLAWGTDNPKFLAHPKLAPELQRLGISELGEADQCHLVGPVEFEGGRCTAPLTYYLYGEGELSKYNENGLGYCVEVHILAGIANKPPGGGDISIEGIWFHIESNDDPEDDWIRLLIH